MFLYINCIALSGFRCLRIIHWMIRTLVLNQVYSAELKLFTLANP